MIHQIYSNLPTFKNIQFKRELNILLARKTKGAKEKQTYNSSGKSSILEIIHFLTGSKKEEDMIFRNSTLRPYRFGITIDLGNDTYTMERCGDDELINSIYIVEGDTAEWPISPTKRKETDDIMISNLNWTLILGHFLFGLKTDREKRTAYGPSFTETRIIS